MHNYWAIGMEAEKEYFLKAVGAFKRRFLVVSPEFKILAANCQMNGISDSNVIGRCCYEVFYERSSPCENCAVKESIEKRKPILIPKPENTLDIDEMPCFFAYPIYSGDKIEAFVSMDFDLPTRGGIEEKLQRSNAFLRNLIFSAVDGVIAADKTGKILIFNDAATNVFGYSVDEALNHLNVRNIYPGKNAYEVMRNLRSEEYGGKGKLRSFKIDIISKTGEIIPIHLNASIIYENGQEIATMIFEKSSG